MFVMSFQMYIEAHAPNIAFFNSNNTIVHTIQTSGNYIWPNAVPTLQTFAVPNIDLSAVTKVVVASTSPLASTSIKVMTFNASDADVPPCLCSMTFSAEPPVLIDNVTNETILPTSTTFPINANAIVGVFPKLEYNFKPYYAIIPKLQFIGTPTVPVSFVFTLTCGSTTITSSFSINTATAPYTNVKIPLQSGTGITMDGRTFNVSSSPSNVTHLLGSNNIKLGLTSITTAVNLQLQTNFNEGSGMMLKIFGTGVTIDPIFSPSTITIKSPITFASSKSVNFPAITNTSIPGAITYTIDPTTFATIDAPLTPSIKMKASSSGSSTGGAVIFAKSDIVLTNNLPISGFHPGSIYSQIRVNDYATLAQGTVVPFVNVAKDIFSSSVSETSFTANMFINITQNVTLDSLNFGYMIDTFLATPRIANGGYAATITSPATATITFTVESVPSSQNDPLITYGSVALTARPTSDTQHVALHTAANNANGSNDGTLMSIPFTTSAITPLPTYVSAFTPAASGSLFAFNAGDQIRIRMNCNTKGSYWSTKTINGELGELGGSLICVPKDNPYVPNVPIGIISTFGNTEVTRKVFETAALTVTAKRIITGFRLFKIRIADAVSNVNVQVDIFKNNGTAPVLQVFFAYKETSPPTKATLEIPFSYAEYYRIHSAIPANVSRIDPTSLYYNKTQNPIFNANEIFQMKITFANDASIDTNNPTDTSIAGVLSGISLNTSTLTIDPLNVISPIFGVRNATTTVSINKPTSNSDGKFVYYVSNDLKSQIATDATTGNLSLVLNPPSSSGFRTQLSISAFQRSSSSFTDNSIAYPTIDYINTNYTTDSTLRLYTVAPTNAGGQGVSNRSTAVFTALIVNDNTRLVGFSFQFFGRFSNAQNGSNMQFTFNVEVRSRSNPPINKSTTISFVSNGNTEKMLFIPFSNSNNFFTRRPTGVDVNPNANADANGILYTNTDNTDVTSPTLQIGDLVTIYVNSPPGVSANTFQSGGWGGGFSYNESALIGSLVTTCTVTTSNYTISANPTGSTNTIFNDLASEIGYKMNNTAPINARIVLREFSINLSNTTTGAGFAIPPTPTNPRTIIFGCTIISTQQEYSADIVVRFTANINQFTIPFNMPCPGDVAAAGDWGYTITEMNITPSGKTSKTTNLFTIGGSSTDTSISSFSFPIVQMNAYMMVGDVLTQVSPRIRLNVDTHAPNDVQFQAYLIASFAPT